MVLNAERGTFHKANYPLGYFSTTKRSGTRVAVATRPTYISNQTGAHFGCLAVGRGSSFTEMNMRVPINSISGRFGFLLSVQMTQTLGATIQTIPRGGSR